MEVNYSPVNQETSNICFIKSTVPEILREKILESIEQASTPANNFLVGAINDEKQLHSLYEVKEWHDYILMLCEQYNEHFGSWKKSVTMLVSEVSDLIIELDTPWVNRMKKYEYNPVHMHSGVYSYVLWVKVPYNMEDEKKVFPDAKGDCHNGAFSFIGEHTQYDLCIDKGMEWELVLFAANQHHCVYPFYTSDEERISIAGNVKLAFNKPEMMMNK